MTQRNDGGPAFPEQGERGKAIGGEGMSMRDWFAGMAAQGLLAERLPDHHGDGGGEVLAQDAYMVADAMLAEREREKS